MSIIINTDYSRPSKKIINAYRKLLEEHTTLTPVICDMMNRLNAMNSDIKPLYDGIKFVGAALTVKTLASDLAPVMKSVKLAQKDDVIVIDSGSSKNTALWGATFTLECQLKDVAGTVTDSSVRDVAEMKAMGFPVFCAGVTPRPAALNGYGYINHQIQCGGVVVNPGDIIVADDSGVAVVPQADAESVLEKTKQFIAYEVTRDKRIRAGEHVGDIVGLDRIINKE